MSISQNDQFKILAPKDITAWTGKFEEGAWVPFEDTDEAIAAVPEAYRFEGLGVRISTVAGWRWYVWRGGVGDVNLVEDSAYLLDGEDSAYHLSRTNHTGTQLAATISDFTTAARASFTAGTNVSIVNGVISSSGGGGGGGSSVTMTQRSGNGSTYQFVFPHGVTVDSVPTTPTKHMVTSPTHQSDIEGWTVDATNFTVTLSVAPATGTNNVLFSWIASAT